MSRGNFLNTDIVFEDSWKKPTMSDILEKIVRNFPNKNDFIEFYQITNGGRFVKGAYFYPTDFYKDDEVRNYVPIEVSSFFYIPLAEDDSESDYIMSITEAEERREDYSEEFEEFTAFHIPFADNHADNDFWIDIQTGEIKYMDYEGMEYNPYKAIIIAPSFKDFCKHIQSKRRKY